MTRRTKKKRHPAKGALVKAVSKPLPRELLSEPAFRKEIRDLMHGYSGLYALYKKKRLYYVGLASKLFRRLDRHTRDRHKKKWNLFAIFRIRNARLLKDIETLVLQIAKPPGNAMGGRFRRDADVTRVIKRIQRQNSRMINRIRRKLRESA